MAAARTVARAEAITATPVSQPPQEDFPALGRHSRGPLPARHRKRRYLADLVDDKLAKPRGELIVHAAAAAMWTRYARSLTLT
jgi:hypothetical protein